MALFILVNFTGPQHANGNGTGSEISQVPYARCWQTFQHFFEETAIKGIWQLWLFDNKHDVLEKFLKTQSSTHCQCEV